jgi:hypothetical protein
MHPLLRLEYLDNMGIIQYVARTQLPGAMPSTYLVIEPLESSTDISLLADTMPSQPDSNPLLAPSLAQTFSTTSQPKTMSDISSTILPIKNQRNIKDVYQCQIAYWRVNDLLILADMPRLDNGQLSLLNDILFAIKRDKVATPDAFRWPPHNATDPSLSAARDYFQGMLEGGILKKHPIRQILIFGKAPIQLLNENTEASTDITDTDPTPDRFQNWPIITLDNLRSMIDAPSSKAAAWKKLAVLAASA